MAMELEKEEEEEEESQERLEMSVSVSQDALDSPLEEITSYSSSREVSNFSFSQTVYRSPSPTLG